MRESHAQEGEFAGMDKPNQTAPVSFETAHAMIASDEALREALDRVRQLDFTMLKRKLTEERAWTSEFCDEVESLYRSFLALNARYPNRKVCPTGPIDAFWGGSLAQRRALRSLPAPLPG
jgi:hypothetical protein